MKQRTSIKIILAVIITIGVFAAINFLGFSAKIKNTFYLASSPIQNFFWQAGNSVSTFFNTIFKVNTLRERYENLLLENQKLLAEIATLKEYEKENIALRDALQIGLEKDYEIAFARIAGKDTAGESIVIDKGAKDGLSKDMAVITPQKSLVGRISGVFDNFSRVQLISSTKSSFDAKIQDKNITGVLKGEGNQRIFIDLLPVDAEIKEGDVVVTNALGGIFPAGILIGRITSIRKTDTKPFQQANVMPFFDLKDADGLFVITSLQ